MKRDKRRRMNPDGNNVTIADLPAPNTMRWLPRFKVAVVAAVENGLISFEEASSNYGLSHEEYCSWRNLPDEYGFRKKARSIPFFLEARTSRDLTNNSARGPQD